MRNHLGRRKHGRGNPTSLMERGRRRGAKEGVLQSRASRTNLAVNIVPPVTGKKQRHKKQHDAVLAADRARSPTPSSRDDRWRVDFAMTPLAARRKKKSIGSGQLEPALLRGWENAGRISWAKTCLKRRGMRPAGSVSAATRAAHGDANWNQKAARE